MYNDSQYIRHSSDIICHAGKKGMKWGQGPFSKLKGYVAKSVDAYKAAGEANKLDKSLYEERQEVNSMKARSAELQARANAADSEKRKQLLAIQRGQYNGNGKTGWGYSLEERSKKINAAQGDYNSAKYSAQATSREALRRETNMHAKRAKAASARRKANKSLFGRARLIFGNPKKKRG